MLSCVRLALSAVWISRTTSSEVLPGDNSVPCSGARRQVIENTSNKNRNHTFRYIQTLLGFIMLHFRVEYRKHYFKCPTILCSKLLFFVEVKITNAYFSISKKHFTYTNSKHLCRELLQSGLVRGLLYSLILKYWPYSPITLQQNVSVSGQCGCLVALY